MPRTLACPSSIAGTLRGLLPLLDQASSVARQQNSKPWRQYRGLIRYDFPAAPISTWGGAPGGIGRIITISSSWLFGAQRTISPAKSGSD